MRIFKHRKAPGGGDLLTWLCAGAMGACVLLVVFLMLILVRNGFGHFLQRPLDRLVLENGSILLGEIHERETAEETAEPRVRIKLGNRDITGSDFRWVEERSVLEQDRPREAVLLERMEWGNFYGFPRALRRNGEELVRGSEPVRQVLPSLLEKKRILRGRIRDLEKGQIGDVNYRMEHIRLREKKLRSSETPEGEVLAVHREIEALEGAYRQLEKQLQVMREELLQEVLVMATADGVEKEIPVGHIVRVIRPNDLNTTGRAALFLSRLREFLLDDPRESNTEGGIFPAIFGTVMMVFLMVFFVTPLGVLAAVYMREYAKQGWVIRSIRIAVNNLAGVPSIVFGVFGLGFFVYVVGGSIDRLFYPASLPTPTFGTGGILWASLTLALLTVPVVIVATEEGLAAVPRSAREGSLALGATKFETTWKVVVPGAAPGILTGIILAMARAAGEVAPLMIVGMVKLAPALPIDHNFPFVHLERKFMHLGFHIYDLGFQSPNVEAVKPMVFATALLLVLVVAGMNLFATMLRNHLRRKYASSAV